MIVDIIIPTYNRPALLKETLESVAGQTYPNWVCWIVEDGDTQDTCEAVKPFLEDDRFRYLTGEHYGFPSAPRNRGISKGNAGYIAFLDDDDLWLPEKLEKQVAFLDGHPECVLLGCNAFYWSNKDHWGKCPLYFKKNVLGKIGYEKMIEQDYLIHSSVILRRTALEKAGLYNETLDSPLGEDYEVWLRVGALGEIWALPEPYVVYRATPQTYYPKLDREQRYRAAANILESALNGVGGVPSPLSYPGNEHLAIACRSEIDFYRAGPRFLGRFRHGISSKIKALLHP